MNKIDINDFNVAVVKAKENPEWIGTEIKNWNGIDIEVHRTLNFTDAMKFVDMVVSLTYDEMTGNYTPELKDLGIRKSVIDFYTNVELSTDIEKCHEVLYETDLFEFVLNLINRRQLNMIVTSIDDKLNYITQTNIDVINRKMNELTSVFEDFMKNFEGIDISQFQTALDSLQELGITAQAITQDKEK